MYSLYCCSAGFISGNHSIVVYLELFLSSFDTALSLWCYPSEPSESYSQQGSTLHIADFGDIHVHTYAVSAPLKLSRDCALTILFSSLFHAVGVLTKNEFLYVSVLANGICICMSFFFLVLLSGKYLMYLSAGIPTIPFCILNNMFNLFLSLLFSSVSHFKSANIWVDTATPAEVSYTKACCFPLNPFQFIYLASLVWVPGGMMHTPVRVLLMWNI